MSRLEKNFKPFHEGPIFDDQESVDELIAEVENYLDAARGDAEDAVAEQNIHDRSETSFRNWVCAKLPAILDEMGITVNIDNLKKD